MKRFFLMQENKQICDQQGDVDVRYAPCSTFKIPLALMGFDSGFLLNEHSPTLAFKAEYPADLECWKQPHTPALWMRNSCVWYSQCLTTFLGMPRFQMYVSEFGYGNQNLTGDIGQNNGLTRSWLSSSLHISVFEQVDFLEKFLTVQLPVSRHAHDLTKQLLLPERLVPSKDSAVLRGKTGSGRAPNGQPMGWFVGWVDYEGRCLIGAQLVIEEASSECPSDMSMGQYAKSLLKESFIRLI